MLTTLKTWSQRREAMRQLSALSDRALADLGILRSDIGAVIRSASAPEVSPALKPRAAVAVRSAPQTAVAPTFAGLAGKA